MDFFRIGDKVVSRDKIDEMITEILQLRMTGLSQAEVGDRLGVERTFISRLEGLGEIRKGHGVAVIGFPIKNKAEVEKLLHEYGVDYHLLMTEKERNDFASHCSGSDLINRVIEIAGKFRSYHTVIIMASDYRSRIIRGMLDNQVIEMDIGKSPLKEDVEIDMAQLEKILKALKG